MSNIKFKQFFNIFIIFYILNIYLNSLTSMNNNTLNNSREYLGLLPHYENL